MFKSTSWRPHMFGSESKEFLKFEFLKPQKSKLFMLHERPNCTKIKKKWIFKSQILKRLAHVANFIRVKCATWHASKSIFDRSSPHGQSRGKQEFRETFLTKNPKPKFWHLEDWKRQNKINRGHFRKSWFVLMPTRLLSFKTWASYFF